MSREARGEQADERRGDREQTPLRDRRQAEIGERGHADARDEPEQRADDEFAGGGSSGRDQAVHEERNLRAFAHHRDGADHSEREDRLRARPHRFADPLDVGCELAAMARHPDVVPGQHHDGDDEDRGVEDFLADPRQGFADRAGKGGHERRADQPRQDARPDGEPAARKPPRYREHDADDQPGLDDLAKDDDERAEHRGSLNKVHHRTAGVHLTTRKPSVVSSW